MKLSVSNIAWDAMDDQFFYHTLLENGFQGIEIAPTRIIPVNPYEKPDAIGAYRNYLLHTYGLEISSIQSIYYGRTERIFESHQNYEAMLGYTKKVINFASEAGCPNIVFGCPKNRNLSSAEDYPRAVQFFRIAGDYALSKHTTVSIEANPVIYQTNFINTTTEAVELARNVSSKGFMVNLDLGTIIYNEETLKVLKESMPFINHIHISEPGLAPVIFRDVHYELRKILDSKYENYVSLEMKYQSDKKLLVTCIKKLKEIFQ